MFICCTDLSACWPATNFPQKNKILTKTILTPIAKKEEEILTCKIKAHEKTFFENKDSTCFSHLGY